MYDTQIFTLFFTLPSAHPYASTPQLFLSDLLVLFRPCSCLDSRGIKLALPWIFVVPREMDDQVHHCQLYPLNFLSPLLFKVIPEFCSIAVTVHCKLAPTYHIDSLVNQA